MDHKLNFEVISINGNRDKIQSCNVSEIEIDKKYDFKAFSPNELSYNAINPQYNAIETSVYLVLSNKATKEELFHFIYSVKLLSRPDGKSKIHDIVVLYHILEYRYTELWFKSVDQYAIPHNLLTPPLFDIVVIEKMFEYFDKWGYYIS